MIKRVVIKVQQKEKQDYINYTRLKKEHALNPNNASGASPFFSRDHLQTSCHPRHERFAPVQQQQRIAIQIKR